MCLSQQFGLHLLRYNHLGQPLGFGVNIVEGPVRNIQVQLIPGSDLMTSRQMVERVNFDLSTLLVATCLDNLSLNVRRVAASVSFIFL